VAAPVLAALGAAAALLAECTIEVERDDRQAAPAPQSSRRPRARARSKKA
jgi:hypothetical protein